MDEFRSPLRPRDQCSGGRLLTREEVIATYQPIRAAIRHVLGEAVQSCSRPDLTRAAKQLGLWDDGQILADDEAVDMLVDVALFEPNQRGRRAYDRFLADGAKALAAAEREMAQRMGGVFFSVFQHAGRHEVAGLWLEDLLEENRRLWLMDEALTLSAPEGAVFGMRLFDAGAFHAGFGIVAPADELTIESCIEAKARGAQLPVRHSLAATLYGDIVRPDLPDEELVEALLDLLPPNLALPGIDDRPVAPPARSARRRKGP